MKNKIIFNKNGLKSYRSSLRNRSTWDEAVLRDILKSRNLDGRKSEDYTVLVVMELTSVVHQKN
jgi:hypothetical protein